MIPQIPKNLVVVIEAEIYGTNLHRLIPLFVRNVPGILGFASKPR